MSELFQKGYLSVLAVPGAITKYHRQCISQGSLEEQNLYIYICPVYIFIYKGYTWRLYIYIYVGFIYIYKGVY